MKKELEKIKSWILLSAAASFMICIFAPLEVYLTNVPEFWFRVRNLLPAAGMSFVLSTVVFTALGFCLKKTGVYVYALAVFGCLFLGFYIQGNYIPRDYGVLDGKEIDWDKYAGYGAASAVLWSVMLVLCIVLCTKFAKYAEKICSFASAAVFLILAVTLAVLFAGNLRYEKDKNAMVVTQKDMFSLSGENNVVVLLYDTFDASYLREITDSKDGAQYRELLADFIYYPNAAGGYPTTKASLPFILTGQWYENQEPFGDYVQQAYEQTDFYDFLNQQQYAAGVYTSPLFLSRDTDIYTNVEEGSYSVQNVCGFAKDLLKLAGFHYLPHQLKKYSVIETGDFNKYAKSSNKDPAYTMEDIPEFTEMLEENGISVNTDTKEKAFRFYHLTGAHPNYEFGEKLKKDGRKYSASDEAKGCLQSLKRYCDSLKEAGIYDNTVIIAMADHGFQSDTCCRGCNPLFMVKKRQANHPFQVSDTVISWENLLSVMKSLILDNSCGEADSDTSLDRNAPRFLYYSWDDSWGSESLPQMIEYELRGSHGDGSFSMLPTGRIYAYEGLEEQREDEDLYKVDETADISVADEIWEQICLGGASTQEKASDGTPFRWTSGDAAVFQFGVKDPDKNYRIRWNCYMQFQENSADGITVKINGKKLENEAVGIENHTITVWAAKELIAGNRVVISMEFPNAASPKELGLSDDERKIAVAVSDMNISAYKRISDLQDLFTVRDGAEISVKDAAWDQFAVHGMGGLEQAPDQTLFRWTLGKEAEFVFYTEEDFEEGTDRDFEFLIDYFSKLTEESLDGVKAQCNGQKLAVSQNGENQLRIRVPSGCLKMKKGCLKLSFPHAISPKALGQSDDDRELSIAVCRIKTEAAAQGSETEK